MGRLRVSHPHRNILVHDHAEECEEDEKGHDRTDGRGHGGVVRPEIADHDAHMTTLEKSFVCIFIGPS
jgi:hypothetical protein